MLQNEKIPRGGENLSNTEILSSTSPGEILKEFPCNLPFFVWCFYLCFFCIVSFEGPWYVPPPWTRTNDAPPPRQRTQTIAVIGHRGARSTGLPVRRPEPGVREFILRNIRPPEEDVDALGPAGPPFATNSFPSPLGLASLGSFSESFFSLSVICLWMRSGFLDFLNNNHFSNHFNN